MVILLSDFISPEEEAKVLENLKPSRAPHGIERNTILRYGSQLPYAGRSKSATLPEWVNFIVDRIMEKELLSERPDHLTINEYHKGQVIDWHIDSKGSGEVITVLSLESEALMGLKDKSGTTEFALTPRTLLQLSGDDRWKKKHCIYPVKSHRWSLVFRKGTKT